MSERDAEHLSTVDEDVIGSLGPISIQHPPDTFGLTPASLLGMKAVAIYSDRLAGIGLDWGSGTGCLAITAALVKGVEKVVGLEVSEANVQIARRNAEANGVADKVSVLHSDSYTPLSEEGKTELARLRGQVDFIVANPPAMPGGDGFGFRRAVLTGALDFLKPGGFVLLNISIQYSDARIRGLCHDVPEYTYGGLLASTDWVPFDMNRSDLGRQVVEYAEEEERGGLEYHFRDPTREDELIINARDALARYWETGLSPLSKWQNHLYVRKIE